MAQAMDRRTFLSLAGAGAAALALPGLHCAGPRGSRQPNILFIFADQHRASALGCYGDPNVSTPNFDAFATKGIRLTAAVSPTPVCCPYRASLMTGQFSHNHGMMSNSVDFFPTVPAVAETFRAAGYRTGYIGKWHLEFPASIGAKYGNPKYVPPDRRLGFDWWRMAPNGHNYYSYTYFAGDNTKPVKAQEGYAPTTQANQAMEFIEKHSSREQPWLLFLAWGPPHTPYNAPDKYRRHYVDRNLALRPNVPSGQPEEHARKVLPDYYGLVESLDVEFGRIMDALEKAGAADDTIVVYTSDHGDMLGSHGYSKKRWPHVESSVVPFLIRYPRAIPAGRAVKDPFGTPDIYPTLTGLAGVKNPEGLDGDDFSAFLTGQSSKPPRDYVYLQMHYSYVPWPGWRGLHTGDYLYARTEKEPWLLFDLGTDPYQLNNLAQQPSARSLLRKLDAQLSRVMKSTGDSWEARATSGDLDNWVPGSSKFRSNDLGVDWPGKGG